jgi:hypothetical protein
VTGATDGASVAKALLTPAGARAALKRPAALL